MYQPVVTTLRGSAACVVLIALISTSHVSDMPYLKMRSCTEYNPHLRHTFPSKVKGCGSDCLVQPMVEVLHQLELLHQMG